MYLNRPSHLDPLRLVQLSPLDRLKDKSETGLGVILADKYLHTSEWESEKFWARVTNTICNPSTGKGGPNDLSFVMRGAVEVAINRFNQKEPNSGRIANFIAAGQRQILTHYEQYANNDSIRDVLGQMYIDLIQNEELGVGWAQAHQDYIQNVASAGSTLISSWMESVNNPVYGVGGTHPITLGEAGQHIATYEMDQFLKDTAVTTSTAKVKTQLFEQVHNAVVPALKTSREPVTKTLTTAYTQTVEAVKDGYGAQASENTLQRYRHIPSQAQDEDKIQIIQESIEPHLVQLDKMVADVAVGVGGKNDGKLAKSVMDLYKEEIIAFGQQDQLVQAAVWEKSVSHALAQLHQTKNPHVHQFCQELFGQRLLTGQAFNHRRKLDAQGAQTVIKFYTDALKDNIYGIAGERSLQSEIERQLKDYVKEAKRQPSDVQLTVLKQIEDGLKTATRNASKTQAVVFNGLYDNVTTTLSDAATVQITADLCAEPDPKQISDDINVQCQAARTSGTVGTTIPEELVREAITAQVTESNRNVQILALWTEYAKDLTDSQYGADGSLVDMSATMRTKMGKIRAHIATMNPEWQWRYLEIGKEVLLAEIKRTKNPVLVEEFKALIADPNPEVKPPVASLQEGRLYGGKLLQERSDKVVSEVERFLNIQPPATKEVLIFTLGEPIAKAVFAESDKKGIIDKDRAKLAARRAYFRDRYWDSYLNHQFDPNLAQGTPLTDVSKLLKAEQTRLMTVIQDLDYTYTGSFMRAAVDASLVKIESLGGGLENSDQKQRIGFALFALLTHSPIATRMNERESEIGLHESDMQGAKRTRTLGSIQTEFVKRVMDAKEFIGAFTMYIETKLKKGDVKDADELRLCMALLTTVRNFALKRQASVNKIKIGDSGVEIALGEAPDNIGFARFSETVIASIEASTSVIRSGVSAPFMEILAAMGNFSPRTLIRLGYMSDILGRLIKDGRKLRDDQGDRAAAIDAIYRIPGLSEEERFILIYQATGKMNFDIGETTRPKQSPMTVEIISRAAEYGRSQKKERDSLEYLLMWRDDICQVTKVPGIQPLLGDKWDDAKVSPEQRKKLFGTYMVGAISRIRDPKFAGLTKDEVKKEEVFLAQRESMGKERFAKTPEATELDALAYKRQMASMAATELIGISMMLEETKGELDSMKDGTIYHEFSKLLLDVLMDTGDQFAPDVKYMAERALKQSVPFWSQGRTRGFIDLFFSRINASNNSAALPTTPYHLWIEEGRLAPFILSLATNDAELQTPAQAAVSPLALRSELVEYIGPKLLDLVHNYATIGGRNQIRSVGDVVLGTTTQWPDDNIVVIPKKGNALRQIAALLAYFATVNKTPYDQLPSELSGLAVQDLIQFAQIQKETKALGPIANWLQASQAIAVRMDDAVVETRNDLDKLVKLASEGLQPLVKIDDDGRIVEIPGAPKLLLDLKKQGVETVDDLVKGIRLDEKEVAVDKLADDSRQTLATLDGIAFVKDFVIQVGNMTGGDNILGKFVDVVQRNVDTNAATGEFGQAANMVAKINLDSSNATGLATVMAGIYGAQSQYATALSTMLSTLADKSQAVEIIRTLLESNGREATYKAAEKLHQEWLGALLDMVVDQRERIKLAATERHLSEVAKSQQLTLIRALEVQYNKTEAEIAGDVANVQQGAIQMEIAELTHRILIAHTNIQTAITAYENESLDHVQAAIRMRVELRNKVLSQIKVINEFVEAVSYPSGPVAQRAAAFWRIIASWGIPIKRSELDIKAQNVLSAMGLDELVPYIERGEVAGGSWDGGPDRRLTGGVIKPADGDGVVTLTDVAKE